MPTKTVSIHKVADILYSVCLMHSLDNCGELSPSYDFQQSETEVMVDGSGGGGGGGYIGIKR